MPGPHGIGHPMTEAKTSAELLVPTETALSPHLRAVAQEAHEIIAAGVPANTRRTYRSQWATFLAWCEQHQRTPLPVSGETLVLYLTDRAREVRVSSLRVALAAITVAHREAGHTDWAATDLPGVKIFLRGLQREKAEEPQKKQALTAELLQAGLPRGESWVEARDRAILLLGFFSAMRRSEIAALNWSDLRSIPGGIRIRIGRSKTDQEAKGQVISVPQIDDQPALCPVRALSAWRKMLNRQEGPVFPASQKSLSPMDPAVVAEAAKRAAKRAGCDPSLFAGHSLRSGFATSAAKADAAERDIMQVTRHKSERTVREYIQEATLGDHHPGRQIVKNLRST